MNTYLLPVCENNECYIYHSYAHDINTAKEKFMTDLRDEYNLNIDLDVNDYENWDDFVEKLNLVHDIILGDVYDKEEF
jgi:hypothetical protein